MLVVISENKEEVFQIQCMGCAIKFSDGIGIDGFCPDNFCKSYKLLHLYASLICCNWSHFCHDMALKLENNFMTV